MLSTDTPGPFNPWGVLAMQTVNRLRPGRLDKVVIKARGVEKVRVGLHSRIQPALRAVLCVTPLLRREVTMSWRFRENPHTVASGFVLALCTLWDVPLYVSGCSASSVSGT